MRRVLASYLSGFCQDWEIEDRDEDEKFEVFVNFCVVARHCPTRFDPADLTTNSGEVGIDGAAVLIGDEIVISAEEAEEKLQNRRKGVDVHYIFTQSKNSDSFSRNDILNFGDAVEDLISRESRMSQSEWLEEISDINDVVIENADKVKDGIPRCSLFHATTGDWQERKSSVLESTIENIERKIEDTKIFGEVSFVPTGFDKIREYYQSATSPVSATIEFEEEINIPAVRGVKQAYMAIVKADHFVDEVVEHDNEGGIRPGIFDQNVRHFLGYEDNEVNKKIENTIRNEERKERFPILNNGITILSPDVKRVANKVTVEDFQIVNGCQTSHVLYHNREFLDSSVKVPLRIIETEQSDIVDEVVEATNSQSEIPDSQMYALEDYVIKLQEFFDAFSEDREEDQRVYFERRTREYSNDDIAAIRVFDIHLLAKVFAAMFLDLPHLSTAYAGRLYQKNDDRLFEREHPKITYYTAAFVYYKLRLVFSGQYEVSDQSRFKWQILMILKYQICGDEQPNWSNNPRMKIYCERILDAFSKDTRDLVSHVEEALDVVDPLRPVDKDQRKTKSFTDSLKENIGVS